MTPNVRTCVLIANGLVAAIMLWLDWRAATG